MSFSNMKALRSLCLSIILASSGSLAQTGSTDRMVEIKRALQQTQFQAAANLADSAIANFRDYLPEQLAEIHAFRALIFFEQNNPVRAEEHLALALQLNPSLQLDSVFFSPKIQSRLEQLRPQIATLNSAAAPAVRYIVLPDQRIEAAWRSLFVPGWGQRFKGQKTKGKIFSITTAAFAGATMASHLLRGRAEKDYLAATAENEISARYDTFNRYHLLRNNFALALGIVWSSQVLDALIIRVEPNAAHVGFIPTLQISPTQVSLRFSL